MSKYNLQSQITFFKLLREYLNWTQVKLANEIGVSERTVIRWENGFVVPHPSAWNKLIRLLKKVPLKFELKRRLEAIAMPYIDRPQKLTPEQIFCILEEKGIASQLKAKFVQEMPDLKPLPFRYAFAEYTRRKPSVEKRILASEIAYQKLKNKKKESEIPYKKTLKTKNPSLKVRRNTPQKKPREKSSKRTKSSSNSRNKSEGNSDESGDSPLILKHFKDKRIEGRS